MAERRMLARTIIESDAFSNMPVEAQMLYVRLNMAADDDGFVKNPRMIMRMCGASDDSMKLLILKKFVLSFEYGDDFLFLIKHWKVHNYLRSDRYKASAFKNLLREVYYDENKAYSLTPGEGKTPVLPPASAPVYEPETDGIPAVYQMETQVRLGKDRVRLEEGEVREGEDNKNNITDGYIAPKKSDEEHAALLAKHAHSIDVFERQGFPTDGIYRLAEIDGVTRQEIAEYRKAGETT